MQSRLLGGCLTWLESAEGTPSNQISFGKCGTVLRLRPARVHVGTFGLRKVGWKQQDSSKKQGGGTPILPGWLAATVDWLQVSHWQRKGHCSLLCVRSLCEGQELLQQGHIQSWKACELMMFLGCSEFFHLLSYFREASSPGFSPGAGIGLSLYIEQPFPHCPCLHLRDAVIFLADPRW